MESYSSSHSNNNNGNDSTTTPQRSSQLLKQLELGTQKHTTTP